MDRRRRVPFYQVIDGVKQSPFMFPAGARDALNYTPRDGDVTIVTYPKCGTHWAMRIVQLILRGGQGVSSFRDLVMQTPHLENHGPQALEGQPSPRIVATHLKLLQHNFNERAKYVYVARNPWDACVSFYHYARGVPEFQFEDGTFDDFLEAFVTGDLAFGDYFDHVLHGYARKDDPNVVFCTYEELKADAPGVILKLAYFLGEEYGRMLEVDQEMFQELLKKSSFEFMSSFLEPRAGEVSAVFGNLPSPLGKDSEAGKERKKDFRFFRNGKVNDWKAVFSPENIQRMQARIDEKTTGTDIMKLWNIK